MGGELKCYIQTYRASDEVGPRGAFAPKNKPIEFCLYTCFSRFLVLADIC